MNIDNIQSLIAHRKLIALADIDPTKSYVQIGVYQPGNRENGSANANTYAPFVIPISDLAGEGYSTIQHNYVPLIQRNILNFTGTGFSVIDTGSETMVDFQIPVIAPFFTPHVAYVDADWGSDFTGEVGNPKKPFLNIDAATMAVVAGETVVVQRGSYFVGTSLKPNVSYFFGHVDIACVNLITNAWGPGQFKIYGHANFTSYTGLIIGVNSSDVYLEADNIQYYQNCITGSIYNSNITIKCLSFNSINNGAFGTYLEGDSINVTINIHSDSYIIARGFISWFNGTNPITINLYGRNMIHTAPDYYASLAWLLGPGITINFYVDNIIINGVAANSFFPWYGILNVWSKITVNADISWIMADGGITNFYGDINAPLGLLYIRGGGATVILRANLVSGRPNNAVLVTGILKVYGNITSTDTVSAFPIINLNNAASVLSLNSAKIIGSVSKACIEDTSGAANAVNVYGSCYSVTVPVNITQAPNTITQFAGLE